MPDASPETLEPDDERITWAKRGEAPIEFRLTRQSAGSAVIGEDNITAALAKTVDLGAEALVHAGAVEALVGRVRGEVRRATLRRRRRRASTR